MKLLKLHLYHLSEEKARKRVVEILKSTGISEPSEGWYKAFIKIGNKETMSVLDLVSEMRLTGVIKKIQEIQDRADAVFGGSLSIATTSKAIKLRIKHGSYEANIPGPGLIIPTVSLIADDILDLRRFACEHSNEPNFEKTTRYFSIYLILCMAMIEHFMYRYLFIALQDPITKSAAEEVLAPNRRFDDRMDLWLQRMIGVPISSIKSSVEWGDFLKLKNERNKLIHGLQPYYAYSIKDLAKYLNLVRTGIGGLMKLIRDLQQRPSLIFIDRLLTAPLVEDNK